MQERIREILRVCLPEDIRWINTTPENPVGEPVDLNMEVREATAELIMAVFEESCKEIIGKKPYYDDGDFYADEKEAKHQLIDEQLARLDQLKQSKEVV